MKADLKDITFLILIRLDSIERLENIAIVVNILFKHFNTNVMVVEAANHNNGLLKSVLHRKTDFQYIEDQDPILYKTKYFNWMAQNVATSYMAIWDADIVPDKKMILKAIYKLRNNQADMAFPYNGLCYDVCSL